MYTWHNLKEVETKSARFAGLKIQTRILSDTQTTIDHYAMQMVYKIFPQALFKILKEEKAGKRKLKKSSEARFESAIPWMHEQQLTTTSIQRYENISPHYIWTYPL